MRLQPYLTWPSIRCILLCYVTLYHVTLRCITLHRITLQYITYIIYSTYQKYQTYQTRQTRQTTGQDRQTAGWMGEDGDGRTDIQHPFFFSDILSPRSFHPLVYLVCLSFTLFLRWDLTLITINKGISLISLICHGSRRVRLWFLHPITAIKCHPQVASVAQLMYCLWLTMVCTGKELIRIFGSLWQMVSLWKFLWWHEIRRVLQFWFILAV